MAEVAEPLATPVELHGPSSPSGTTPVLSPGGRRRTSTLDLRWMDGVGGPHELVGLARDVVADEGVLRVLRSGEVALALTAEGTIEQLIVDDAEVEELRGISAGSGFRGRAASALSSHRMGRTPEWALLDDVPVVHMVRTYARVRAGFQPRWVREGRPPKSDICAGWQRGGTLVRGSIAAGRQLVTFGPPAPTLELVDQPEAWHDAPSLPPTCSRRRRRLDVTSQGTMLLIDAFFRDTYSDDDGVEVVVHEYALSAELDAVSRAVVRIEAAPHVLPYVECPSAAASAQRLVGRPIHGLRDELRAELVGISTCTHLNDLLRSLEDVEALLGD